MKLHTLGTIELHGRPFRGVILEATIDEIQAFGKLYASGCDDFTVVRKPESDTTTTQSEPGMCAYCGQPIGSGSCQASHP